MPINEHPINYTIPPVQIQVGDFAFEGLSLKSENITIRTINDKDVDNIDLSQYEIAGANGENISDRYYRGRTLKLVGSIRAKTAEEFMNLIDSINKNLSKKNGVLTMRGRKIHATVNKINYKMDHYHITFSPLEIEFRTTDAFWNKGAETFSMLGVNGPISEEISYYGTAESYPIFYCVFGDCVTTEVVLNFKGLDFTIPGTFEEGDILIIDGEKTRVTKNGTDVDDYTGDFPKFTDISNPFSFDFSGTVEVDITVIFSNNYL